MVLLHGDDGDYVDDIITVIDITWLRWTRALVFYVIIHIILKHIKYFRLLSNKW
jgi:hypothetical protein